MVIKMKFFFSRSKDTTQEDYWIHLFVFFVERKTIFPIFFINNYPIGSKIFWTGLWGKRILLLEYPPIYRPSTSFLKLLPPQKKLAPMSVILSKIEHIFFSKDSQKIFFEVVWLLNFWMISYRISWRKSFLGSKKATRDLSAQ